MSQFLIDSMEDARRRTLRLIDGLDAAQLMGPKLPIVNPLLWEIGHTAYFYEYWILRHHLGEEPVIDPVDSLYDSITIAHDDRWDLPLPDLAATLDYMREVQERVCRHLEQDPSGLVGVAHAVVRSRCRTARTCAIAKSSTSRKRGWIVGSPPESWRMSMKPLRATTDSIRSTIASSGVQSTCSSTPNGLAA